MSRSTDEEPLLNTEPPTRRLIPFPSFSDHTLGCLFAITGCCLAGVTHGIEKILLKSMGVYELTLARNISTLVISFIYIKCHGIELDLPWKTHAVMISTSLLKALVPYLRNFAIINISLSEFTALMFTDLVYIAPMASIWYKKCLSLYDLIGMAVCTIGTVLVIQPSFLFDNNSASELYDSKRTLSIVFGIVATLLSTIHTFSVRDCQKVPIPYMMVLLNAWGMVFGSTMIMVFQGSELVLNLSTSHYALLVVMLSFTVTCKVLELKAKKMIEVYESAVMSTFEFIVSFGFQFFVFKTLPRILEICGDFLICLTIIYFACKEKIMKIISKASPMESIRIPRSS